MNRPEPALKSLFDAASRLPAGPDRESFLDRACDDATLRGRVAALLKANDEAGRFLDSAAPEPSADTIVGHDDHLQPPADPGVTREQAPEPGPTAFAPRPSVVEGPGSTIGPYKLLQRIGEGGMGTVFMAEQEKPIRRKVALKVIKPGMDSAQVIARFEAERQALALMDHPNIARVLDVGATANGRPYFVMELVKGVPITEYCDRNHLTPRERLELFLPVCRAIQHAHQKGIIHRDIKPSNVMVTLHDGVPEPRVIDFGVAKAIEQRLTERTMFTEYGAIIGTLEYMSPEQAEMGALDVDTRSDIYSLGVLLYELLTGSTPLEKAKLRQAAYSEILRRIREEEPARPSTRLGDSKDALPSISAQRRMEPARLSKLVRGDLDWIVMKSLDKDRTRRYETANGFARDIQRYLDGDAVEASPPSASYKLRKFARKHRGVLATAAGFAALLVAATAVSAGLAYWANKERLRADAARAAALVAESAARGQRDRAVAAEAIATEQRDRAVAAEAAASTAKTRALAREALAIDAVRRFADVVERNPDLKDAPALDSLRKALLKEPQVFFEQLRDQLQGAQDTAPESLARFALASVELGQLHKTIGDFEDALRAFQGAVAVRERLTQAQPANFILRDELAAIYHEVGMIQIQTGRPAEAMQSYSRSRAIYDQLVGEDPASPIHVEGLAKLELKFGGQYARTGRLDEAIASTERARSLYDRLGNSDPDQPRIEFGRASSRRLLGEYLMQRGVRTRGIAALEEAQAILEQAVRDDPGNEQAAEQLALVFFAIAEYVQTGSPADALKAHTKEREIWERLARDHPSNTAYQNYLATVIHNIGYLFSLTGRSEETVPAYQQSLAIRERLARDHPSRTWFQEGLAFDYHSLGVFQIEVLHRPVDALASYEQARIIQERMTRLDLKKTQTRFELERTLRNMGGIARDLGRLDEALRLYEQARSIGETLTRDDPHNQRFLGNLGRDLTNIGNLHLMAGRSPEAVAALHEASVILNRARSEQPMSWDIRIRLAETFDGLGSAFKAVADPTNAAVACDHAGSLWADAVRDEPANLSALVGFARNRDLIAFLLTQQGRAPEAKSMTGQAVVLRRRADDLDPQIIAARAKLAGLLQGEVPKDNAERLTLALMAYTTRRYRLAVRLFAEAFAADSNSHEDRQAQHPYNAACSAALAAADRGEDEPLPGDVERSQLRAQALAWLAGELATWGRSLDAKPTPTPGMLQISLEHWKVDSDLATIRDAAELARLPAPERAGFEQLWADVDRLLARTRPTP